MVRTPARRLFAGAILGLFLLVARPAAAQAPAAPAETALKPADISKIIEMLENDQQRTQFLNLLKLMAASPGVAPAGRPKGKDLKSRPRTAAGPAFRPCRFPSRTVE